MKYELTRDEIEEMAACIADCGLSRDDAARYAVEFAIECQKQDVEDVECQQEAFFEECAQRAGLSLAEWKKSEPF